jgi:glycosyltransferase involved in cell wall biosynthesis
VPSVLNSQPAPAREFSPGGRIDVSEKDLSLKPGHAGPSVVVVDPSCFSLPYDYSLCDALVRQGCKVTLAQSEFTYDKWELPGTFDVWKHFYRHTGRRAGGTSNKKMWKLAKGAEHAFSMRSFVAEIAQRKPDIVHFEWLLVPALDQFFLPQLSRHSRLVLTLHNTASMHGSLLSRLHQKMGLARALSCFDEIIVHTEFSRRTILDRRWAMPEKVHVVPHGVLDYYQSFGTEDSSSDQNLQILFFGNIEKYKGLDILLQAFARIPEGLRKQTRLIVAGRPGCDMSELYRLSSSLGIEDQIKWDLRFIPEADVAELFRSASLVALPYLRIDQSGVLMTAIGFEKPIVATRIGGIPETIQDGVHGALADPGDVAGLAVALETMLADPAKRHSAKNALHTLRTGPLSWDHSAAETVKIYQRLLDRNERVGTEA